MEFIFPVIKDPIDNRDHLLKSTIVKRAEIPETFSCIKDMMPIRNQEHTSECCAFSAAAMKEYQERKDVGFYGYMSPEYVYSFRQTTEGMYIRDAMDALLKHGICTEYEWPFNTKKNSDERDKLAESCSNYKIASYVRCETVNDVKKAIYTTGPVMFSVPVYNKSTRMWIKTQEANLGGHAMLFVGYTPTELIIRNSWGTSWGDNGYTRMPIEEFVHVWDAWCAYDEKSVKKTIVLKPPVCGKCEIM